MKDFKVIIIATVIGSALLLSGCEKKGETPVTEITPPPTTTVTSPTLPGISPDDAIPQQDSLVSQINTDGIEAVYSQNLALAKEDADKVLNGNSKLCFAKVDYLGGIVDEKGEYSFFFENDQVINGYYWLVTFDGYSNNQKKRYLAAKKDWEGEVTCTTLEKPASFATGYNLLVSTKEISSNAMLTSTHTTMTLNGDNWEVRLISASGETIFSKMMTNQTPKSSSNTQPQQASPTPTSM